MKIKCAGIVLYNPDIDKLIKNYNSISNQVDMVILIDNNSINITDIRDLFSTAENVVFIENKKNLGIATALNQISGRAKSLGYDWVYLLDQDSISSPTVIKSYKNIVDNENVALLTPYIVDINKISLKEFKLFELPKVSEVDWAITSGSLIKLDVWEKVGKFTDDLFIDAVDIDYSIRLRIDGYRQLRINSEYLLQEVGNAEPTIIFRPHKDNSGKWSWKRYYRTNHSLIRQYYMVRNNIILARKYRKYRSFIKGVIFVLVFTVPKFLVEKHKFKLFKMVVKGIKDGFKHKVTIYQKSEEGVT